MPGISTSSVITSGLSWSTLTRASLALKAVPTTSTRGEAFSPLEIMVRARTESSTTRTRIFLLDGHMTITPSNQARPGPEDRGAHHFFWKVDGATVA